MRAFEYNKTVIYCVLIEKTIVPYLLYVLCLRRLAHGNLKNSMTFLYKIINKHAWFFVFFNNCHYFGGLCVIKHATLLLSSRMQLITASAKFSECTFWADTMLSPRQGAWGSLGMVHPFCTEKKNPKNSPQNGLWNHRGRCLFKQNGNRWVHRFISIVSYS